MELNINSTSTGSNAAAPALSASDATDKPFIRIEPAGKGANLNLREFWAYRELLYFFTWRDLKVRYKQTALGGLWAIIQPLFTMIIFSVIFGKVGRMAEGLSVPYPIWSFAALVPWFFFASGMTSASISMTSNVNLVKKIYFPRLTMPIAPILSSGVDFLISFVVLLLMMVYFHSKPTVNVIWLPFFVLLAGVTALGVGLWMAAINVRYRDVKYVMPFITQVWLFVTPIAWQSQKLSEPWLTLQGINPMSGVVEGFRWALLGQKVPDSFGIMIAISSVAAVAILISGAFYFKRMEAHFADIA